MRSRRRSERNRLALGPRDWIVRCDALAFEEGSVCGAQIDQVDRAAPVVKHRRVTPGDRRMLEG